jgi:nucleoside-diphosphate-sugar epimerase
MALLLVTPGVRLLLTLCLLFSFSSSSSAAEAADAASIGPRNVLVLGSGGLIGSHVVRVLESEDRYHVVGVRNRAHVDLRVPGALEAFLEDQPEIHFCFFLACEVGGSKFIANLTDTQIQRSILQHNLDIYASVIPALESRGVPFVFTSSYVQYMAHAYGSIKRIGERFLDHNLGKTARLWNVYGVERIGLKSHVISDWAHQCAAGGHVQGRTSGLEMRQFLHASDAARALVAMMEHFDEMAKVTTISSEQWVSLRDIGALLGKVAGCEVRFSQADALSRELVDPDTPHTLLKHWQPQISLEAGMSQMVSHYRQAQDDQQQQTDEKDEL